MQSACCKASEGETCGRQKRDISTGGNTICLNAWNIGSSLSTVRTGRNASGTQRQAQFRCKRTKGEPPTWRNPIIRSGPVYPDAEFDVYYVQENEKRWGAIEGMREGEPPFGDVDAAVEPFASTEYDEEVEFAYEMSHSPYAADPVVDRLSSCTRTVRSSAFAWVPATFFAPGIASRKNTLRKNGVDIERPVEHPAAQTMARSALSDAEYLALLKTQQAQRGSPLG